jgi:hypothetical protein
MYGVFQPTVCRAIHHVTAAICARRAEFIHFPSTPEKEELLLKASMRLQNSLRL